MTDALHDGWADALGQVLAETRREWLRDRELTVSEIRAEVAHQMLALSDRAGKIEREIAERLAGLRDGEPGPPGETPALEVPDEIAPMVARAISLLAESAPFQASQPAPAVVNVNMPSARTERSRVKHDAQGRVVEIERDVA